MKKYAVMLAAAMGLLLCGCGNAAVVGASEMQDGSMSGIELAEIQGEDVPEGDVSKVQEPICMPGVQAVQGGPYGEIVIPIPDFWDYEVCPTDSDRLVYGLYGIQFSPKNAAEGYVVVAYIDNFGVCGTGLTEEEATIAGKPASIGTYDNKEYWDFIAFEGDYKGIVALTYSVDAWWDEYSAQVFDILDMMTFDKNVREGGANIDSRESEISEIGLWCSLKNISSTGATFVFHQYDAGAPKGELLYGDAFVLQRQKDDEWENVPTVIEEYGFNAIGYMIAPDDTAEMDINWEWLYGKLSPGEYRIGKNVSDIAEAGQNEEYTVYARFILN